MTFAISFCLFESPCQSWKKIVEEETLSMTWDVSWLFFWITFCLVCFSLQFGRLLGSFVPFFFFERCFEKKERYFNEEFYLVILKVAFKNTISWCCIWALIHRNHFYTSELIEFKAYSAPASTLIPFSNLRLFFKKFKQPAVLDKLSLPNSMLFGKFPAFENKTWPDSTLIRGVRGRI